MQMSVQRKIWIAISLGSLIPVLVLFYYTGYDSRAHPVILVGVAAIICLGWLVIIKMIGGILRLSRGSRGVLESLGERAPKTHDEVHTLEVALNVLTDKVKAGCGQLQQFTQKIEDLNQKVSRKVLTLSVMLQANDLFSKNTPAEEVVTFLSYHLQQLLESDMCFCALRKEAEAGVHLVGASGISEVRAAQFIDRRAEYVLRMQKSIVVDNVHQQAEACDFAAELHVRNIVLSPIVTKGVSVGVLAVGNNKEHFSFFKDDYDVINVFAQNVSLMWSHQELSSKVATLEVIDRLTGLYIERMLRVRLDEEIKRATVYQRPCGFIILELIGYDEYQHQCGSLKAEELLKEVAAVFKAGLNAVDIAGRIGCNMLAAIIIERNKRQSKKVADEIRQNISGLCAGKVQLRFAVAESPLDGMSAQELLDFTNAQKVYNNEV